jgi:hypothetical protein
MSNDNEIVGRRSRLIFETIKPRLTAIIINLTDRPGRLGQQTDAYASHHNGAGVSSAA